MKEGSGLAVGLRRAEASPVFLICHQLAFGSDRDLRAPQARDPRQGLVTNAECLISACRDWMVRRELKSGCCLELA